MKHGRIIAAFVGASMLWGGQVLAMEYLRIPVAMTSTTALVEQTAIYNSLFKAEVDPVLGGENAAVLALKRGQFPFFGSDNVPPAIRPGSNIGVVGEMNVLPHWDVTGAYVKSYKDLPQPVKDGISSPTSGNVYVSPRLLEEAGIPQNYNRLVKVGGSSERLAEVGKIDVGSLTFGMMPQAKEVTPAILGAANQFVKGYAFLQPAVNKNYIKDHPDKPQAMFGNFIRGWAFMNGPEKKEEVMHVLTKVMHNPDDIAKKMYEDLPRLVKVRISSHISGNVYVSRKLLEEASIPQNYIKDHPDKAETMFGNFIRGWPFVNDPEKKEEVMHVLTKVMHNPDDIAKRYEIKAAQGSIPADTKRRAPTTFL